MKRRKRLKHTFEGWRDRLAASRRQKASPPTLCHGELAAQYTYARNMWRWYRGWGPKPAPLKLTLSTAA